jgi:YidC/Oxa1 family membrane protein insertase
MMKKQIPFYKQFKAIVPLAFKNGEIRKMNWYYGPTDYKLLKSYDILEHRCSGLGIFGWINRHAFIPVYGFKYVYTTWLGNYLVYYIG